MVMNYNLNQYLQILKNTPNVLSQLLNGLNEGQTDIHEGEGKWNVKEVLAHLIVCEETNWLKRIELILSDHEQKTFIPIDMKAHVEMADQLTAEELLNFFKKQRLQSLESLINKRINDDDLSKTGIHPVIGIVTLQQLISTWTTHDLTHIVQITRILAKQNKPWVGKFETYLSILN